VRHPGSQTPLLADEVHVPGHDGLELRAARRPVFSSRANARTTKPACKAARINRLPARSSVATTRSCRERVCPM